MIPTIDTHCHLDLIAEQGQDIPVTLEKSKKAGVQKIVQIATDLSSSRAAQKIAETYNNADLKLYYTIGCHPTEKEGFSEGDEILNFASTKLDDPAFMGIGEIGLDLFHDAESLVAQEEVLEKFLDFAGNHKLPVVIHSRDAAKETLTALSRFKGKTFGVIHCFTYDFEAAKAFLDLGYYISFSGIVSFKSAKDIQEAASKLPLNSILIETDAPFLSPVPFRGKRNDPSHIVHTLEKVLSLRDEPNQEIIDVLLENSNKFIGRIPCHA